MHSSMLLTDHANDPMSILHLALAIIVSELCILGC